MYKVSTHKKCKAYELPTFYSGKTFYIATHYTQCRLDLLKKAARILKSCPNSYTFLFFVGTNIEEFVVNLDRIQSDMDWIMTAITELQGRNLFNIELFFN